MTEFFNELIPFVKNHHILALAWVLILIVIIYMTVKIKLSKVKFINNDFAIYLINKEDAIIIDLRSNDRFRKGHITDAYNILPIDIKNNSIKMIEKFKTNPIVLIDDNGTSVGTSGDLLHKQGFTRIFALKEGIAGWANSNLPLVKK